MKILKLIGVLILAIVLFCLDFGFIIMMCSGGSCDKVGYQKDFWYLIAAKLIPIALLVMTYFLIYRIFREKK